MLVAHRLDGGVDVAAAQFASARDYGKDGFGRHAPGAAMAHAPGPGVMRARRDSVFELQPAKPLKDVPVRTVSNHLHS